jgi:flagellar biosynthesis/type III secretory pathway protein FliH
MSRSQDIRDLQMLIDVLVSVSRRRRTRAGAHKVHVHPDDLPRYRQLAERMYGTGARTLDDLIGLPVRADPNLGPGEVELWP